MTRAATSTLIAVLKDAGRDDLTNGIIERAGEREREIRAALREAPTEVLVMELNARAGIVGSDGSICACHSCTRRRERLPFAWPEDAE